MVRRNRRAIMARRPGDNAPGIGVGSPIPNPRHQVPLPAQCDTDRRRREELDDDRSEMQHLQALRTGADLA